MESIEQFLAMQTMAFERLDWPTLGQSYCDGDGSTFFDDERLDLIRQVGNEVSLALIERLNAGGRSVYVGAGVAELIPILCEAYVLERDVHAVSLNRSKSNCSTQCCPNWTRRLARACRVFSWRPCKRPS